MSPAVAASTLCGAPPATSSGARGVTQCTCLLKRTFARTQLLCCQHRHPPCRSHYTPTSTQSISSPSRNVDRLPLRHIHSPVSLRSAAEFDSYTRINESTTMAAMSGMSETGMPSPTNGAGVMFYLDACVEVPLVISGKWSLQATRPCGLRLASLAGIVPGPLSMPYLPSQVYRCRESCIFPSLNVVVWRRRGQRTRMNHG